MSSNTLEQKKRHQAHQRFRDLLKQLWETGECLWPYKGKIYKVVKWETDENIGWNAFGINALVKRPRKRGFKVTPAYVAEKHGMWVAGSRWRLQPKHIFGIIVDVKEPDSI